MQITKRDFLVAPLACLAVAAHSRAVTAQTVTESELDAHLYASPELAMAVNSRCA